MAPHPHRRSPGSCRTNPRPGARAVPPERRCCRPRDARRAGCGRSRGDVVLEQRRHPAVPPPVNGTFPSQSRPWWTSSRGGACPVPGRRYPVDGGLGGVDCRDDAAHPAAVLDLKAVDRVGLVRDLPDPEVLIQVADHLRQGTASRGHGRHPAPRCASMVLGRGAATRVPLAIESAAASSAPLMPEGPGYRGLGLGTYFTTPLSSPKLRHEARRCPPSPRKPPAERRGAGQ